jgi:ribosome biogenesis GTPase
MEIDLVDLGFEKFFQQDGRTEQSYARIIRQDRDRYIIQHTSGIFDAEVTGKLRFMAQTPTDLPAVGDWVIIDSPDDKLALIHEVLPRKSLLERKAVQTLGEKQVIAANIDIALILIALDRDFNLNRIERYVSIVNSGRIKPVVLLSKSDILDPTIIHEKVMTVRDRIKLPEVYAFSNYTGEGMENIRGLFKRGITYCLLGSSGVGKSTLINIIEGQEKMKTSSLSRSTGKGKHTTTFRELRILKTGGILIDTPGMREIGLVDNHQGISMTFEEIELLAADCKFNDCTHTNEPGCAVQRAIQNGEIDQEVLDHYKKLEREVRHFASSVAEKRKIDRETGKLYKQILKEKKKKKY